MHLSARRAQGHLGSMLSQEGRTQGQLELGASQPGDFNFVELNLKHYRDGDY